MDCVGLKDSGMCMCNQFRSVDRKDVIDKFGYVVDTRLKEKIDPDKTKNYISSVRGVGYKLC